MSRELVIFGDGPHAREMADIIAQINRVTATWNFLGFLVREGRSASGRDDHRRTPVLGDYRDVPRFPERALRGGVREPPALATAGAVGNTRCPERVRGDYGAYRSAGCVVYPHCFIGSNAVLDDHVFVLSGCTINHDDHLEDHVTVASGVLLAGSVHVEANTYLGQGCMVRQNLRIGRGSFVGMGSVVVKDVPPNSVMIGNPARILRRNSDEGD